jgi:hypothetical protein
MFPFLKASDSNMEYCKKSARFMGSKCFRLGSELEIAIGAVEIEGSVIVATPPHNFISGMDQILAVRSTLHFDGFQGGSTEFRIEWR